MAGTQFSNSAAIVNERNAHFDRLLEQWQSERFGAHAFPQQKWYVGGKRPTLWDTGGVEFCFDPSVPDNAPDVYQADLRYWRSWQKSDYIVRHPVTNDVLEVVKSKFAPLAQRLRGSLGEWCPPSAYDAETFRDLFIMVLAESLAGEPLPEADLLEEGPRTKHGEASLQIPAEDVLSETGL